MSLNVINSVSSAVSTIGQNSTNSLSEETKKKLKALGVDVSKITSESEGQQALAEAQAKQAPKQAQPAQETIKTQVDSLASSIGVNVSNQDKISDILTKISNELSVLKAEAANDPKKLADLKGFQDKYTSVSNAYQQEQSLKKGMDATASYNRLYHNI